MYGKTTFVLLIMITVFPIAVSLSVVVACSVVVAFVAGVLGGFAGGTLVGYCWGKTHSRKPHPPPPSAPLYEDITPGTQLELKENVTYGHVSVK